MKKQNTLRDLVYKFDENTGRLLINVETLEDVREELGKIRIDMNNVDYLDRTSILLNFKEAHHYIRILSSLLDYTVNDLNKNFENTYKIKELFFDEIVRTGKEVKELEENQW